ncbi:MAG: C13 family peptidase [Burkholderiales bacterium]
MKQNLLAGARLALFLPVRAPDFRVSAADYVVLLLASFAFWLAGGMLRTGFPGYVDTDALKAGLAQIPLMLAACLVAARLFRQPRLLLAFAVLLVAPSPVFEIVACLIYFATGFDAIAPFGPLADAASIAWAFAALVRAQVVLTGWRGRVSALALALFAGMFAFFVWVFPRFDLWTPPLETAETGTPQPSVTREDLFHRQGELLDEQLSALLPERPGVEDLYFVAAAPYGLQDTFARELMVVRRLMDERFDAAGRSIALVSHPATLRDYPVATVSNLRATLRYLGRNINVDEDVVFLHIATHGSTDNLLLFELPPLELQQLTPTALARMFADSGIKWKVIVLSACFSGGFIEPLKDDDTLIMTAADATHSSFGCEYDSDITWFSEALYGEALRRTFSFADAFEQARRSVTAREKARGYEPSNPQIFVGAAIRGKLAALERRLAARAGRFNTIGAGRGAGGRSENPRQ